MIISVSGKINSGKDTVGKIIQLLTECPHFSNQAIEDFISRDFPHPKFEIKKFADKLKDITCMILSCTRGQLEDRVFKETELGEEWWYRKLERRGGYGTTLLPYNTPSEILENYRNLKTVKLTPRLLLQLLGTECGRDILHPNIWLNALMSEYKMSYVQHKDIEYVEHKQYPNWIITDTRFPNELDAVKAKGGITIKVNRLYSTTGGNGIPATFSQTQFHPSETALDTAKFDHEVINDGSIEELIEKVKQILTLEKII